MEWGLLAGLLGFVSCWPGAVFSGWLLWVLDGEMGSMPVSEKLHAYPSPNPKLTLTCYQLTIGRGGGGVQVLSDSDPRHVCNTCIF